MVMVSWVHERGRHRLVGWDSGVALALAAGACARLTGWLTSGGAVAAVLVGGLVLVGAGWLGAGALLTFFVTSSLMTVLRCRVQGGTRARPRRWEQVLANGGVAGAAAAAMLLGDERAWAAMLASLAAANADTWGTELGRLLGRHPRMATTLRRVPAGTSGAVTLAGLAASAVGAGLVAAWGPSLLAITTIGWCGALLDSLLGATLQARFRCETCGAVVETSTHCDGVARLAAGVAFLSNDAVNLLATLFAGVAGYLLVAP